MARKWAGRGLPDASWRQNWSIVIFRGSTETYTGANDEQGALSPARYWRSPSPVGEKRISTVAGRTEPCSVFSGCLGRCKCVALKPWILRCFWIEPELTNEPMSLNFFSAVPELERLILVFLRQHLMTLPYRFGIWASHPKKNPKKQKSLASFETRLPLCIGELDSTQ